MMGLLEWELIPLATTHENKTLLNKILGKTAEQREPCLLSQLMELR